MQNQGFDQSVFTKTVMFGTIILIVLTFLTGIPVLGVLFLCLWFVAYPIIGAAYGHYSKREGYRAEVMSTALYGGAAAAVSSIVPAILAALLYTVFSVFSDDASGAGLWGEGFLATCGTMISAGIAGAIGGGLYGLFVR